MKNHTPELKAHLASGGPFIMADLYTFEFASGEVRHYTSFDADLAWNGDAYSATGPVFSRSKTRTVIGLEVDTLDVSVYPKESDLLDGLPMIAAARSGGFDGAWLRLEVAFLDRALRVIGTDHRFSGLVSDIEPSRTAIQMHVNSALFLLNTQLPRNQYQATCLHALYDGDCGLQRSSWGVAATVGNGSTASVIQSGINQPVYPDGWFDRGYILFSNGDLAGTRATIKSHAAGVLTLLMPLPVAPATGSAFTAYAGCDKSMATCQSKFNNVINFKGMPFIPVAETAA